MCKTIVYRVENRRGFGPYGHDESSKFSKALARQHSDMNTHPSIRYDFSKKVTDMWKQCETLCGCTSISALAEWFDGFGERLREHGFHVVAYEVTRCDVGYSGKQVVFTKPSGAKPLATWLCDYVISG